ncbi:hypothetical protein DND36_23100 [Pseudomonas savastanoi pv. glycinea]|nr:hypothetical protein DND36_23100 [Pseudomonas savastanoi pv. glycinea]
MHAHALRSSFYSTTADSRANAPRWHAFRDAPLHKSAPHRTFQVGRRASRNAFPRRARER